MAGTKNDMTARTMGLLTIPDFMIRYVSLPPRQRFRNYPLQVILIISTEHSELQIVQSAGSPVAICCNSEGQLEGQLDRARSSKLVQRTEGAVADTAPAQGLSQQIR